MEPLTEKSLELLNEEQPNAARVYDYFLGGHHNFAKDRELAEQVLQIAPQARAIAFANRAFLGRVVRSLVGQGIEQFLDLGSGIPTKGNVHEIAQTLNPACRIVYVDQDPVAVEHSNLLLRNNEKATAVLADVREMEELLAHPIVNEFLDFEQPIGILLMALLHFVPEDDVVATMLTTLRNRMAPGSLLGLSHGTIDDLSPELAQVYKLYENSATPPRQRTREEVERLFAGLALVEPGVVWISAWHPTADADLLRDTPTASGLYGGVGRKR